MPAAAIAVPAASDNAGPGGGVVLCAVADDQHVQDVVATGRAIQRASGLRPLFVHVAAPAVRLRVPMGFAAGPDAPGEGTLPLNSSIDDLSEQAREAGLELLQRASIEEDESFVVAGDPVAEINRVARERDAALVVVGSHRRGAVASAVGGSVSRALARGGACPVLIASGSALPGAGGPVVCGIDAVDDRAVQPALRAGELALAMNRSLVLVHVVTGERLPPAAAGPVVTPVVLRPSARQKEHARCVVDAVGGLSEGAVENLVVEGDSVAAELDRVANDRRADLLVVGCRGAGVVRRALEGSVSLELLRNGRRPLVIVPPA